MQKYVFITGADGFIGSHLTELLIARGYKVKALAQYNSFNSWGWLEDFQTAGNLEIITGDIRDPQFVKYAMSGCDTVFHLAALIAIPYSYHAPASYVETNVMGTLNICQAARELGGIRVLNTSTSEVYGTAQYVPIDEKHPKQPQSPYSASKIAADAIAMSFYNSFNLPVTTVRPFNTYGPRQSARAVIPTIITQIAGGANEVKLGDITTTRDFNYVGDVARGFLAIAESGETIGREINIASNTEISVADLFQLIRDIMKSNAILKNDQGRFRPPKSEVYRLNGDNTLLKSLTEWKTEVPLAEGLKNTIEWFLVPENLKKYKPGIFNL